MKPKLKKSHSKQLSALNNTLNFIVLVKYTVIFPTPITVAFTLIKYYYANMFMVILVFSKH